MDATWVETRNRENFEKYLADVCHLVHYVVERKASGYDFSYRNDDVEKLLSQYELLKTDPKQVDYQELAYGIWGAMFMDNEMKEELNALYGKHFCSGLDSMQAFDMNAYDRYLDESFEMPAGDYIITDPCYLEHEWDYEAIKAGAAEPTRWWEDAFAAAMPSIHMRGTLYGDWGCTVFDTADIEFEDMPKEQREACAVGRFCADAGEVCVVRYDEVAAYNPEFISKLEKDLAEKGRLGCHYATVIRNFEGTGYFNVREEEYEYHGEICKDYDVIVRLDGRDAGTGKHIVYESRQTSL